MDFEKISQDQWKAARDSAATTTKIALVLFAALVVAWMGLWDNVNKYRSALASRRWLERQNQGVQTVNQKIIGPAVVGWLLFEAEITRDDKKKNEEIRQLAKDVAAATDPLAALRKLPTGWRKSLLSDGIATVTSAFGRQRQTAVGSFRTKRASAEKAPFKLLGLDFSVDGFWAWVVWLLFLAGGLLYLWLARLGLVRRCNTLWHLMSTEANVRQEDAKKLADSLPLWVRPLPSSQEWVPVLTNVWRTDLALDPLSALCVTFAFVCIVLAVFVVRLSVISTLLLERGERLVAEPIIHGFAVCILIGLIVGIVVVWSVAFLERFLHRRRVKRRPDAPSFDDMDRRAWIISVVAGGAAGALYAGPVHDRIERSILRRPRFRQSTGVGHGRKRTPKLEVMPLSSGFYRDLRGQIHYVTPRTYVTKKNVSIGGCARSLSGKTSQINPWSGPFDFAALESVHPSAVIPFVRVAVSKILRGLMHRRDWRERTSLLANPVNQRKYTDAFELISHAIAGEEGWRRRRGTMPNLQLYDLLGSVALNSQSKELLEKAQIALMSASVSNLDTKLSSIVMNVPLRGADIFKHSHHVKRKHGNSVFQRRVKRLISFQGARLSLPSAAHPVVNASSTIPNLVQGTWTPAILTSASAANSIHVVEHKNVTGHRSVPRHKQRVRIHRKRSKLK